MRFFQSQVNWWWLGVSTLVLAVLAWMSIPAWSAESEMTIALDNLEILNLGRKYPTDTVLSRIHRLEQKLHRSSPAKASLQFRLEQLCTEQHTLVSPQHKAAALKAYNTGVEQAEAENWTAAAQAYREAIRLNPKLVQAYNNLASLLESQDQAESASELYETALKYAPKEPLLYRNLGIAYEKRGNIERAMEMYRHYLKISPKPDPPIASIVQNMDANAQAAGRRTDYVGFATSATHGQDILWPLNRPIPVMIVFSTPEQARFVPTVQKGLQQWEAATEGRIFFDETAKPPEYGILLTLENGPLSHPVLDIGHAEFQRGENRRLKVTVRINVGDDTSKLSFADREQQVYRLVLHELGHAIGIWGHSPDPRDIMYTRPIASGLSERDVQTINRLYHFKEEASRQD